MIRVVLERPEQPASLLVFAQSVVVAGRGGEADDAALLDWLLPYPDVSRRQCRFSSAGGELFVEGLSERSPTYVNGRKAQGMTRLQPGDAVRFGHCVVRMGEAVPAAPRETAAVTAAPGMSPARPTVSRGALDARDARSSKPASASTPVPNQQVATAVERPAAAEFPPIGEDMSILVERARHWDLRGRPLPLLLSGPLLQRGRSWLRGGPDFGEAGGLVRLFVEASVRARRSLLRRVGVAASVTLATVLGGSAVAQALLPELLSPALVRSERSGKPECRAESLERANALVAAGAQQADDTVALLLTSHALQQAELGGCRNVATAEPTLRELLTKRHSRLLDRREGPIRAVVTRQDGRYVAAADASGRVTIWDVAGKQDAAPLDEGGLQAQAQVLAWSGDDRWLATGTAAGEVMIWDVHDPAQAVMKRKLSQHQKPIAALAFSPEGGMLASADVGELRLWDMGGEARGDVLGRHTGLTGPTTQLLFNASALRLFGLSDGKVRVWPIAPAGVANRLGKAATLPSDGRIVTMVVSLDGAEIVTGDAEGLVLVWQHRGGAWKSSAGTTQGGAIVTVALLPRRKAFLSVASDRTLSIVDFAASRRKTAQPPFYPLGPLLAKPQHLVADPSERRALTIDESGVVELWNLEGQQKQPLVRFEERPASVLAATSRQSMVITGEVDGSLRVWDMMLEGGSAGAHTLTDHRGGVPTIALSREGETLASNEQGKNVQVWHLDGDAVPSSLALIPVKRPVQTLAVSADGRWVAGAAGNLIYVWDLKKPESHDVPVELAEHPEDVMHLAFSVGGEWLVSADLKGTVRTWLMTAAGPELAARRVDERPPKVLALAVSGEHVAVGTAESGGVRGGVFVWRLGEEKGVGDERPVWDHPRSVQTLIFDAAGKHLASGSADGGVKTGVLREERFHELTLYSHGQSVSALAFKEMPDQRVMLASGAHDGELMVSSPDERGSPRKLPKHNGKISGLAFGAAPGLLVSVAEDGAVLWQLEAKGERRISLEGHRGAIMGLQADVVGRAVVTVGSDQTLRVWPLEVSALQHLVCSSAGRNLRPDELPVGVTLPAEPLCPSRR
jgi:WD40 repeat protein